VGEQSKYSKEILEIKGLKTLHRGAFSQSSDDDDDDEILKPQLNASRLVGSSTSWRKTRIHNNVSVLVGASAEDTFHTTQKLVSKILDVVRSETTICDKESSLIDKAAKRTVEEHPNTHADNLFDKAYAHYLALKYQD
jgi:hypothetical protein